MSDSVRPHRRQPSRLPRPWDSPGKNTGVGCHFLLRCIKVKSEREVAQLCPTLSMNCSPPGSSIHGIFQARVLEWGATAFSILFLYKLKYCCYVVILFLFLKGKLNQFSCAFLKSVPPFNLILRQSLSVFFAKDWFFHFLVSYKWYHKVILFFRPGIFHSA